MEFLAGQKLTAKIQELLRSRGHLDMAVAYWGRDALSLMKLNPKRPGLRIVCCLKGGKSHPKVIAKFKFGARRQHDKLHAKVIWTPKAALVSSANASSNGMPLEEDVRGLIEAGLFITDAAVLAAMQDWFENLFSIRARPIKVQDLQDAQRALDLAPKWGAITRRSKMSLFELAAESQRGSSYPVALALFKQLNDPASDRCAKVALEKESPRFEKQFQIAKPQVKNLDWYTNWVGLPKNYYLVDCHVQKKRTFTSGVYLTFHTTKGMPVKGTKDVFNFVIRKGQQGFNFRLTQKDKQLISRCAKDLWNVGLGDKFARIVKLERAAPILLTAAA